MRHKVCSSSSALAHEIAALRRATAADLKERWRVLYSTEPPRRISRDLLMRALAYRIQEKALGGLKPSTRRLLAKVEADASARRSLQVVPEPTLKPGTVLLREWHGTQHQVLVREDGIVFQGRQYNSLSQVAYRITGAKWSELRFFGLRPNRREQSSGTIKTQGPALCGLYPQELGGRARAELQLPARPARSVPGVHKELGERVGSSSRPLTTMADYRAVR